MVADRDAVDPGTQRWQVVVGESVEAPPTVVDDALYVGGSDGTVTALDARTGDRRWTFEADLTNALRVAVAAGLVFVADYETLRALDASDGTEVWHREFGRYVCASPTVVDGVAYVGVSESGPSDSTALHALDARTGEECWSVTGESRGFPIPTVVDDTVYVGGLASADTFAALDAETGEARWRFTAPGRVGAGGTVGVDGAPLVHDGVAYVHSDGLHALDAETGTERWRFDSDSTPQTVPTVADGTVYAAVGQRIYALDVADGSERWSLDTQDRLDAAPTLVDETLYAANNSGVVVALDVAEGGGEVLRYLDDMGRAPLVVRDGTVYVGCDDGHVFALDVATGDERWRIVTDDRVDSEPVLVDDTLYVASNDGTVTAVAVAGPPSPETYGGHHDSDPPTVVDGVTDAVAGALHDAGHRTVADLRAASQHALAAVPGVGWGPAARIKGDVGWSGLPDDETAEQLPTQGAVGGPPPGDTADDDGTDGDAPPAAEDESDDLTVVSGVDRGVAEALHDAGFETIDDLRAASQDDLRAVAVVGAALAARIKADVGDVATPPTGDEPTEQTGTGHAEPDDDPEPWGEATAAGTATTDATTEPGTELWRFDAGSEVRSSPVVVDGSVFVGGENLYALDLGTGTERWCFENAFASEHFPGGPTLVDGTVYAGSVDGYCYAVDAADGTERWRFGTGGTAGTAPTVADGTVYVGAAELYALDPVSGEERWNFDPPESVDRSPVLVDGTVFASTRGGRLYAVDAASGDNRGYFEADFDEAVGPPMLTPPVLGDDTIFVAGFDTVYAVDAGTGKRRGSFETVGSVTARPTVADGTVYVGDDKRRLYAVDADSGRRRWQFETGQFFGPGVQVAVTVAGGVVYAGSGETLYAVDADSGTERWSVELADEIRSSPAVVDGRLVVGDDSGTVYALGIGN